MIAALLALLLDTNPALPPPPATSATDYYRNALDRMRETREPSYAVFHAAVDVINGTIAARRTSSGVLYLDISGDVNAPAHREFDIVTVSNSSTFGAKPEGDRMAATRVALLNATWRGLDDWMRYGFEGDPAPSTPHPAQTPSADAAQLRVIAAVKTFGLAFYDVSDNGNSACSNGDPGRAMTLKPHGNPFDHPLRGVTIDENTGLFCQMHFIAPVLAGPQYQAAGADVTVDLTQVDGYFVAKNERVVMIGNYPGGYVERITASIEFTGFDFPDHL